VIDAEVPTENLIAMFQDAIPEFRHSAPFGVRGTVPGIENASLTGTEQQIGNLN
jgi:hypothetical protein